MPEHVISVTQCCCLFCYFVMTKIALCFVSILEEKCSGIFRARPPALSWTWSTSSPLRIPISNLAFCKLLFHTFLLPPLCPCGILPFLKNVFPEVLPLWLRISALVGSGSLLDCAWHGAAPACPHRSCPAAPLASTWAWTPTTMPVSLALLCSSCSPSPAFPHHLR